MSVNRCYSEKKNGFDVEARSLFSSLHDLLEIKNLTHVRYLCRYDAEGLAPETYEKAKGIVFSEPMADVCYDEDFPRPAGAHTVLAVEPLPGQFDQRADSCAQCIQLLTGGERPTVAAAKIYVLEGELTAADMDKIRGLGFGADDYIEKPFSPSVLVARVRANLAQYRRLKQGSREDGVLRSGSLTPGLPRRPGGGAEKQGI